MVVYEVTRFLKIFTQIVCDINSSQIFLKFVNFIGDIDSAECGMERISEKLD